MPYPLPGSHPPHDDAGDSVAGIWQRVNAERDRAERAGTVAASYEARVAAAPEYLRAIRARMAARHWETRDRHLVAAALHELYAVRMEAWRSAGRGEEFQPVFMSAVAAAIGLDSAAAEIRGHRAAAVVAAASDATARAAHDLEVILGEGPAKSAMAGREPVLAAGPSLARRWPLFGTAVGELGVRAVVAVPLESAAGCLGALCGYGVQPSIRHATAVIAGRVAEALTYTVLLPGDPLFGELDYQAVVHQAAGVLSVRFACAIDDAEAMLRARAFAEGQSVEALAAGVVRGEPFAD